MDEVAVPWIIESIILHFISLYGQFYIFKQLFMFCSVYELDILELVLQVEVNFPRAHDKSNRTQNSCALTPSH